MQHIDNIIFDLGGVILTLNMPETERILNSYGVSEYGNLFRGGNVSSFFKDYEIGKISDTVFLNSLRKLTDRDIPDADLTDAWNAMLGHFPPERIDLLHTLKKKYRLFLFSNTNALHVEAFRKKYFETFNAVFDDHFEKAYYSNDLGLRKPDIASFQHIINEQGLDAPKTLFIDDSLANTEAAELAGLKSIHIKPGMTILDIPF
ncbi:MAG: HAD family phosphatase [Chitinophagaceae bacterium]|nr:HAD family phosphatase [Chitinophagaceae bacterium]MCW5926357.1 HAD family phosphatase [Chitinophagaceae bacterium]